MADFDLKDIETAGATGMDALFERQASLVSPPKPMRRRIASLGDLSGFVRTSADTLIHKSQKDLWAIKKDGGGGMYIERLFDDNGSPLKG